MTTFNIYVHKKKGTLMLLEANTNIEEIVVYSEEWEEAKNLLPI